MVAEVEGEVQVPMAILPLVTVLVLAVLEQMVLSLSQFGMYSYG
jgi:hypothetical protein